MKKILIGTSGYAYHEWEGAFYPPNMKKEDYLGYYAGQFSTVEINHTYYRMPTVDDTRFLLEAGGQRLTFAVKAIQTLTKLIHPDKWQDEAKNYIKAIEPLMTAGRLEAVLFQFSDTFDYTDENRKYLDSLFREFAGIPSVAEFRNSKWGNKRVIEGLRERGIAYASMDLPELEGLPPVLDVETSPMAYFRMNGRNIEVRWGSESSKRYDYLYSNTELERMAEKIKLIMHKVDKVLVYFNNHTKGKAALNAMAMKKILEKAGVLTA